ncbi:MAG: hypothetical protein V1848_01570 [Candidatus Magasanikbacteria bacterium]
MREVLNLYEFFIEGNDLNRSHVLLHLREPNTPEEEKKGHFFALAEINDGLIGQIQKLQEIIEQIEYEYYDKESQLSTKKRFEFALENANKLSHHILKDEDSEVHCAVGIIDGNEIYFSYHGDIGVHVFYSKDDTLQTLDVIEESNNSKKQLFSNIIEGAIGNKDYLYVTTPHLANYVETERVEKLLNSRSPEQTISHIQHILENIKCQYSFGGLLCKRGIKSSLHFKNDDEEEKNKKEIRGERIKAQKEKIFSHETEDEEEIDTQKKVSQKGNIQTNYRPRQQYQNKNTMVNTILIGLGRGIIKLFYYLFLGLKYTAIGIGKSFIVFVVFISNKGNQRQILIEKTKHWLNHKKQLIIEMPLLSKIVLILTTLLIIGFVSSILVMRIKQAKVVEEETVIHTLQAIQDKKNAAEAKLLYNNESEALTLLQEAKSLITSLPEDFNQNSITKDTLLGDIATTLQKLQKIEEASVSLFAEVPAKHISILDKDILAFGENQTIYKVHIPSGEKTEQKHDAIPELLFGSTPKEQDFVLFTSGKDSFASYEKETGALVSKDVVFPNENVNIQALFVYNTRVYSLDTANSQIYKHNKTLTGYDKGSPWLKGTHDLSQAISLAIDGDLYLLFQNGTIKKYVSGTEEPFNITGLEPALTNPIELWTYNGKDEIYILEPITKRIVILNKEGKLIKQITSKEWKVPKSMIVIPEEKTIYVLDSGKIYTLKYTL